MRTPIRIHGRRRATRAGIGRRVGLILALIVGILISGIAGMREADAVGIAVASQATVAGTGHVIALILLVVLFFATAGLVGLFWHHLAENEGQRKR